MSGVRVVPAGGVAVDPLPGGTRGVGEDDEQALAGERHHRPGAAAVGRLPDVLLGAREDVQRIAGSDGGDRRAGIRRERDGLPRGAAVARADLALVVVEAGRRVGRQRIVARDDGSALRLPERSSRARPGGSPVAGEPDRATGGRVEARAGARGRESEHAEARVRDVAPGGAAIGRLQRLVARGHEEVVAGLRVDREVAGGRCADRPVGRPAVAGQRELPAPADPEHDCRLRARDDGRARRDGTRRGPRQTSVVRERELACGERDQGAGRRTGEADLPGGLSARAPRRAAVHRHLQDALGVPRDECPGGVRIDDGLLDEPIGRDAITSRRRAPAAHEGVGAGEARLSFPAVRGARGVDAEEVAERKGLEREGRRDPAPCVDALDLPDVVLLRALRDIDDARVGRRDGFEDDVRSLGRLVADAPGPAVIGAAPEDRGQRIRVRDDAGVDGAVDGAVGRDADRVQRLRRPDGGVSRRVGGGWGGRAAHAW